MTALSTLRRHWQAARLAIAEEKKFNEQRQPVEDTTFLPAALEILETPISPTARLTAWAALILLALTLAWLVLGKVDVVASAQGKLVPLGSTKVIQPATAGIVRAIYVHDGQRVKAGETLIELDPTLSSADLEQANKMLLTAQLDAARARAIISALNGRGFAFVPPAEAPAELTANHLALARAQLADIQATTSTQAADAQAASAARAEAAQQVVKLDETLPLLDQQISANEQMLAKGYVSKLRVIEMRRQRLSTARDRDIAVETARRAVAQAASANSRLAQAREEALSRVLDQLTKAEMDVRLRLEERTKAGEKGRLQRLVSPVDGVVAQLAVHTVGGVVEAAKPIMTVVPSAAPLMAEVKVLNRDAGFVRIGQPVVIKLESYQFTRYGTITGRLESIDADAVADEKLGLVFPARVRLDLGAIPPASPLRRAAPGMAATADIRTGRRSILSYLISPIDQARQEAGREN